MTDDDLEEMIEDLDETLASFITEYDTDVLGFIGVTLARLHLLTYGLGINEDYRKLLIHASETRFHENDNKKPNLTLVVDNKTPTANSNKAPDDA